MPVFTYGKIQDRSGNAAKCFLRTAAGVTDHDYTSEVDVLIGNMNFEGHGVRVGDKIAQWTLQLHVTPEIQEVTRLEFTERGAGGFGSTDTPEFKVFPSPGKLHSPSRPEGAQISGFSETNLVPTVREMGRLLCTYISSLLASYSAKPENVASSTDFDSAVRQALGLISSRGMLYKVYSGTMIVTVSLYTLIQVYRDYK